MHLLIRPWSWWRIVLWSTALLLVLAWQGPRFVRSLRPPKSPPNDFFQEWCSARFFLDGLPVYSPQEEGLRRYLGQHRDRSLAFNVLNAHPPTSVLAALPFAGLGYQDACLTWNLLSLAALAASLWLVARQLRLAFSPWDVLPFLALLLMCYPLRKQNTFGQFNLFLLLLIVGAWAAGRTRRDGLAGALLGTAAAVKLFPAFLFLYFLVGRRWRALTAGALALAWWTALTAGVLGPASYRDYVQRVLPHLEIYRAAWPNASLVGFWHKLFQGGQTLGHTAPLWYSPLFARLASGLSFLAVVLVVAVVSHRRQGGRADHAFGLAVTAMLLLSPVTWDHYFLLLLLPAALLAFARPPGGMRSWTFQICLGLLWITPELYYLLALPNYSAGSVIARPWHTLTVLALQTYALLGLFALGVAVACRQPMASNISRTLRVSVRGENGFCKKAVASTCTPRRTTASSV
jgi:hypothetical protein